MVLAILGVMPCLLSRMRLRSCVHLSKCFSKPREKDTTDLEHLLGAGNQELIRRVIFRLRRYDLPVSLPPVNAADGPC